MFEHNSNNVAYKQHYETKWYMKHDNHIIYKCGKCWILNNFSAI
jgi:hypothetical protein